VSTSHGRYSRERIVFTLSCALAVTIVVVATPFASLWHQQGELSATKAAIAQVQAQSAALTAEAKTVSSASAAIELAREQYQLVLPGQRLVQVLPGRASSYIAANAGDPGFQPLVNPLNSSSLGSGSSATVATTTTQHAQPGFVSRFLRTLEFWR
jgi:cell division protein FtsB